MAIQIGAITDEFSPPDIAVAVEAMREIGMTGAKLRTVDGKNIIDLTDAELDTALNVVHAAGMKVVSIASPLMKCTLPDAPPIDERSRQDVFASRHSFADQPRLAQRAFEIANKCGAKIVRVFSYWRVTDPSAVFERVVDALQELSDRAAEHDLIVGLENEHACNIATAHDTARVLAAIDHRNLRVVWDPANAYVSGEEPFPNGYNVLQPERIAHLHAKDCTLDGHKPIWVPLGEGAIDWNGQFAALKQNGYSGYVHLETHWPGPGGDKLEAGKICGRKLRKMLE